MLRKDLILSILFYFTTIYYRKPNMISSNVSPTYQVLLLLPEKESDQ
jgi:hypothetical protein